MKKKVLAVLTSALLLAMSFAGCGAVQSEEVFITIPADYRTDFVYAEEYVYSDTVFTTTADSITIASGDGLPDTEVVLQPVKVQEENAYEPTYLTPGMPVAMDVEKGAQFRVGIAMQNPGDTDLIESVKISNIVIE